MLFYNNIHLLKLIFEKKLRNQIAHGGSPATPHLQGGWAIHIFLAARLAALEEVADRALLNQCYHPPIGVGRMI